MRLGGNAVVLWFLLATAIACQSNGDESASEDLRRFSEALCEMEADCRGGDGDFVDDCMATAEEQILLAERYDCVDVLADWFHCLLDDWTCESEPVDQGACDDEEELAEDCRNGRL